MKKKVYTVFWVYPVSWVIKLNRPNKPNKLINLYGLRNLNRLTFPNLQMLFYTLFAFCFLFFVFCGCASTNNNADTLTLKEPAVITGIDIQNNAVTITASGPFIYTLYKPGDPYKVVVDLPDVSIGNFNQKIISNKTGLTEIVPAQVETPSLMARLEILLQTPSMVDQEYSNNTLTLRIKEEEETGIGRPSELPKESKPEPAFVERRRPVVSAPLPKATEITEISFDSLPDAVKVVIKGNGTMTPNVFPLDDRIVIDVPDVEMNALIPSEVVSPVKGMRSGKHEGMVRLVLDLGEKTNFDVVSVSDSIVVTLKSAEKEPLVLALAEEEEEEIQFEAEEVREERELFVSDKCETYLEGKENVNFDFQDQEIVPILRLFADISGCNMFIHPDVRGKATMKFRNVPWNQALETLLNTFSLGMSAEGNIIRIAPLSVFAKESEERVKAQEAEKKAEPLETRIFPISYADVSVVESAVRNSKILSPRGSISVDKRTSTMLVKDIASVFPEVENLLATLDRPTPQVLIEARIVEVNTNTTMDLGIQWGINYQSPDTLSTIGGLSGVPLTSPGAFTGGNYLVDFPSKSAGPLSGSGITFGILNPSRTVGLDLQLSALETTGKGKVISNPKILTIDNGRAKILQGKSIPVRKLTTEGTISTEFKDITLELNVTPHITPDKSISMSIEIRKEELDPTVPSVEGVPGTDKKEANTEVIIKDGETVVIGGMYKIQTNESESGVPGLMNIPILGWLFKNKVDTTTTNELLIFITPRIVEKP